MFNALWNKSKRLTPFVSLLMIIYTLTASVAFSATYYVSDSTGNDSNNGTSNSSPWKTFSKVNSRTFQPGDTILFKRGDTWTSQALIVTRNGQSGQPITFAAYGTGNRPKLDGLNAQSPYRGAWLDGVSWIVIDGLDIYRFHKGIRIVGGSSHITVKNNHVSYINDECVSASENSNNVTIDANVIHNCGLTNNGEGVYIGTDPSKTGGVPDRTTSVVVTNNHIYNTGNEGIELKAGTSNCIVRDNLIHDVTEGYNGAIHAGVWANPLIIPNHLIDSNRVYNVSGNGGFGIFIRSGGIKVYNNIIYNTTQSAIRVRDNHATRLTAQVYNNTLYKNARSGIEILDSAMVDSKNNLPWGNGSGNIGYDPLFADATRADLRLCMGVGSPVASCSGRSKAIDSGVNVGLPFGGTAPDLGALESSFTAVPTAPSGLMVETP